MKKRIFSMGMLQIVFRMCMALYWNGNYVVYMLTYIFGFVLILCHVIFSAATIWEKIAQTSVYSLIMAIQILFAIFVIRPSDNEGVIFDLCRLLGVAFLLASYWAGQIFFLTPTNNTCTAPSIEEWSALSYAQLLYDRDEIINKIVKMQRVGKALSMKQIRELIQDLPRHNCFSYISNGSLTKEYFQKAWSSLEDGYLYLILTRSRSAAREAIGFFTNSSMIMCLLSLIVTCLPL